MEIAGLAQQKSKDDRVKAFADQLMKDHQQADSELQTLAKTKNVTLSTDLPSEAVAAKARLSKLEGAAFDRAFVDQMVKDHTQAVKQFEQATKSADAEVKAFADKTLPTLRDHLQRAEDLKRTIGASGK
jgi:putative membrane protein